MERKCITCGKIKKLTSFNKNKKKGVDGYIPRCKICVANNIHSTIEKEDKSPGPRLTKVSKNDYCNTYKLLRLMGYDITGDVHQQFAEKYDLSYKPKPDANIFKYAWWDCLEGFDETDLPTS
jgi:hypothetical protein